MNKIYACGTVTFFSLQENWDCWIDDILRELYPAMYAGYYGA